MTLDIRERGHAIAFGLVTPQMGRSWGELLELWRTAERAGFDAAFVVDHFLSDIGREDADVLESWTVLAAMAREVPRIRIGAYVSGITHRPIAVLAKQAATVDHLSDGRLVLGIGAAWNEREHDAYGIPFPPAAERVDLVADALAAIRSLETEDRTSFAGRRLRLHDAPFRPKPIQHRLPILVGSQRPRMLSLAARYADYVDFGQATAEQVVTLASTMTAAAARVGRDASLVRWAHEAILRADPERELAERVEELAPLGVSLFLLNAWPGRSEPRAVERAAGAFDRLRRRWTTGETSG